MAQVEKGNIFRDISHMEIEQTGVTATSNFVDIVEVDMRRLKEGAFVLCNLDGANPVDFRVLGNFKDSSTTTDAHGTDRSSPDKDDPSWVDTVGEEIYPRTTVGPSRHSEVVYVHAPYAWVKLQACSQEQNLVSAYFRGVG